MRPFNKAYLPFAWRGWYDFGCGSFGDMGCYSFAGVFKILGLTPPTVVEACSGESYEETFPQASIVHLDFPAATAVRRSVMVRRRIASAPVRQESLTKTGVSLGIARKA